MRPVVRSAKNHALHALAICRVSLWTLPQHTVSGNRPASPFSLNSRIQAERPTLPNLLRSDADTVSDGDITTFVGSDPTIRASGHLARAKQTRQLEAGRDGIGLGFPTHELLSQDFRLPTFRNLWDPVPEL